MPVPGCAAGYQPLCPPPFPQRAHLLLLGAPHTPASLEGSSREIQIILLQGFEPIESHKVMRLLETRLLVLGMQESDLPLPGEGCMGLCVCLSVESGWGEGRAVSDVRPCLGRGPGLYMEKRLTLSSGVFFSAFLSFSALFPWMGKKRANCFCLQEGIHHSPYLCWQTFLTLGSAFCSPPAMEQLNPPPHPISVGDTHRPVTCPPLAWLTLAPPPSWLPEARGGQ